MNGTTAIVAVLALIAANGVFVAAEFALVTVRRPVIADLERAGSRRARAASRELSDLSFALSVAQFGITATSLLVGYLAEQALGETLIRPILTSVGIPEQASLPVAIGLAFLLSTMTQVVLGELVPKNVAIAFPVGVALALTPFTRAFGQALRPLIRIFDASAAAVARAVFRIEVATELEGGRSLDELSRIIMASGEEGSLTQEQTALLGRAVELGDTRVEEVMVPRADVYWLSSTDTLEDLRVAARESGHSRFPVVGVTGEDDVQGSVHIKDLLAVPADQRGTVELKDVAVPIHAVPESAPLRQLLTDLRRTQRTFSVVVDEHGGTAGIVTVEDVLERLVGDIEDEFDVDDRSIRRAGVDRWVVTGALRVDELNARVGTGVPDGPYETLAGYILDSLGHVPVVGERVVMDNWTFTVASVDRLRITEVAVARSSAS